MNEKDKKELIAHILNESMGEPLTANDEFDNALFEARVRNVLTMEAK